MVCNLSLLDQLQLPILVILGITFLLILQINNQEVFFLSPPQLVSLQSNWLLDKKF